MFWRNNYANDETTNLYFNSNDRTNYTYSESQSYRTKKANLNVTQPKMMRGAIHKHITELNVTNDENRDYIMPLKSNSTLSTPQKRVNLPSTRRVLRSKTSIGYSSNDINDIFVRESEIDDDVTQQGYQIGALNSNSNNSGPDNVEHPWTTNNASRNYHLSEDEDQGSDTPSTSHDRQTTFGSNNANIKSPNKISNRWFQKNIYGLPNDESDDVQPDFSGTISGDEQYDIAPFQNTNAFQKSKLTKSKHKKTSKSDTTNKRLDSVLCSPVAVLSIFLEYIWLCVVTTTRIISRCSKHLTNYSGSEHWYLMPLYLPGAIINSAIYWFAYSIDRIFGTSTARRWLLPTVHSRRSTFARLVMNTLWLLLWVAVAFIAIHCLFGDHPRDQESSPVASPAIVASISSSMYHIVGQECMNADNCCDGKLALGRRLAFCLFSLPARWVLAQTALKSRDDDVPLKMVQSNTSDVDSFIIKILSQISGQEKLLLKYNSRLELLEKNSKEKLSSDSIQDGKLSHITNEMKIVATNLQRLQSDLEKFDTVKVATEKSIVNVATYQKESIQEVKSDIEKLRKKLEEDMKVMKTLMEKVDNSDNSNKQTAVNIGNILAQIQENITQLSEKFVNIHSRTSSLEVVNERRSSDNINLKQEILEGVKKEFSLHKFDEISVRKTINEEMSKLEESLHEKYLNVLNTEDLRALIDSHLVTVESNIKAEVNNTLWHNVKDHLRNLFATSSINSDRVQGSSEPLPESPRKLPVSASCQRRCLACRRESSCVRVSQVRELIADALRLYSADRIGLADFALESAGGTIATTRCTETYTDRAATLTIFGIPLLRLTNSPRTIIQPNINPGECWAMKGSKGSVVVQLSARVSVTAVSIDHIPKSLSPSGSIDSAIKEFEIKALTEETDTVGKSLGNFTYQLDSVAVQTFVIESPVETNLVEMIVKSNYGNDEYTCIYRVRVHGDWVQ